MLKDALVMPSLPTADIAASRSFYEGKLGLEPSEMSGESNAHYECGHGTSFLVYERPTPSKADHTALAFSVSDFDAAFQELKEAGITFEVYDLPYLQTDEQGVATDDDGNRTAWFKDPGGNILAIGDMGS
jgi:catechol 2,3-dioxygenase-like lactoylglutathione lyase family enzyme